MKGDAAANYRMLVSVSDGPVTFELTPEMRNATLIVDALLGTGIHGAAEGRSLELIRAINHRFPLADVVSVDIPSGFDSDYRERLRARWCDAQPYSDVHRAETLPHALPPAVRDLRTSCTSRRSAARRSCTRKTLPFILSISEPSLFAHLFRPRVQDSNKGLYGHALVIAGSRAERPARRRWPESAALRAGRGPGDGGIGRIGHSRHRIARGRTHDRAAAETAAGSISTRSLDNVAGARHRKEECDGDWSRDGARSGHGRNSFDT